MEEYRNNVVNLYVKREEKRRQIEDGEKLVRRCSCGSIVFVLYKDEGLVCDKCSKSTNLILYEER